MGLFAIITIIIKYLSLHLFFFFCCFNVGKVVNAVSAGGMKLPKSAI